MTSITKNRWGNNKSITFEKRWYRFHLHIRVYESGVRKWNYGINPNESSVMFLKWPANSSLFANEKSANSCGLVSELK